MNFTFKKSLAIAALAALASVGTANASSLVNLAVEASTTGTAGTYSSTLAETPTAGSTLFYEVVAQFAAPGTTNANTGVKTPDGALDSIVTLPNITLTAQTGSFTQASLQNNFGSAASSSQGTVGSSTLTFRAAETGFTEFADSALVINLGQLTVGSNFTGITIAAPGTVGAGSIKVAGSNTAITNNTETSVDPILGFSPLAVAASPVPAPAVPAAAAALGSIGAFGTMLRRRFAKLA